MPDRGTAIADVQELWYQALAEPVGLLIATNDYVRLRDRLYRARSAMADPALTDLRICQSPWPDGQLVITRIKAEGKTNGRKSLAIPALASPEELDL